MANTPFKLKGWSGYQNSPTKKKIWPPDEEVVRKDADFQEELKESKAKAIADEEAKYKAGEITKKELDAAIKEIKGYVEF